MAPNHRVLCASPNYLARHGEPATPDELLHHHFVLITTSAGPLNELNLVRGKQRWNYTVPVEQSWETNGGALCRDWILAGHGIAHKSIWHIAEDVHAGTLKILLPEWSTKEDSVHALFHRNRYMPPVYALFLIF